MGVERSRCELQHPALPSPSVPAVRHTGCAKQSDDWHSMQGVHTPKSHIDYCEFSPAVPTQWGALVAAFWLKLLLGMGPNREGHSR